MNFFSLSAGIHSHVQSYVALDVVSQHYMFVMGCDHNATIIVYIGGL